MKRLLPLILCAGLLSGCIPLVPHRPNANLVHELGERTARRTLRELIETLRSPQVFEVQVDREGFTYYFAGGVTMYWGAVRIGDGALRVLYEQITRVDVYENGKAFMFNERGHRIAHEFLFGSVEDGLRFADLIASFKAPPPPPERRLSEAEQSPWAQEEQARRAAQKGENPPKGEEKRLEGAPR